MKVAVIGSGGQLGSDLVAALREAAVGVVPLSHAAVDVTSETSVREALRLSEADAVVNCAACVRVDQAEDEPAAVFGVNAVGALNVARACSELGVLSVLISTDYVFDGEKETPYEETDAPNPINVYGASKLAGEGLLRQACADWLIVRVASLFGKAGASGKGGNFVETILKKARAGERLTVVDDVRMSPTYTFDAARGLVQLLLGGARGEYHVTNAGSCTWYELARAALDFCLPEAGIDAVDSSAFPTKARRPRNSSLTSSRGTSPTLRAWREALRAYLLEKGHIPGAVRVNA